MAGPRETGSASRGGGLRGAAGDARAGTAANGTRPGRTPGRTRPGAGRNPSAQYPRPHLTSRAAILAIVMCAIALSLAYPMREYFAQRSQIAQLEAQRRDLERRVAALQQHRQQLADPRYIEQEARRRLHYCFPDEQCYVVLDDGGDRTAERSSADRRPAPWFVTLWRSVEAADRARR